MLTDVTDITLSRGAAVEVADSEHAPEAPPSVPGYRILRLLGAGGMGVVYLALEEPGGSEVALKLLGDSLPDSPLAVVEPLLLPSLRHPNVVAIHRNGITPDGRTYFVLEYVRGPNLRECMRPDEPWGPGRASEILTAVACALGYIHSRGVLHLDLKPENVLCGPAGQVKVTDFGLAQLRTNTRTRTVVTPSWGSLDYAAPEQRFGLSVDVRADLFSLATLAYELLTGRPPGRAYVSVQRHQPTLPDALDDVLRRGLARDADDRPATVEEFRRDLELALRGTR
jgi:eukaryotic-like serine/threonine-protein kinase